jgi:conjugal transfer mating pair stabilization protein TraG
VIEALIYASFALVIPLSLLPGGLKIIGNWVWLVAWIQIWPAFYCILNYVMMIHAQSEAGAVFQGCAGNEQGLSFFTSTGIRRLHEDIYALSGYLSASIPFLSYSILQGGIGSFIHMAGAMMTPAHNSAGAIAGEMSSGNLSYANTTMGSLSYGNQSMLQENSAPSIRTGFTELHQENGAMRAGQENVLLWENSRLPTEMSIEKSVAGSTNRATQQMMSEVQTRQDSLSRTFQATSREVGDSIQHEAITDSYTVGESLREGADSRAAANRMFQLGADWCRAQDLSENEVGEVVGGAVASLGTSLGLAASASGSVGANLKGALSRSETARAAMQLAENTQFQEAYDLYQGAANSSGLNHSEDDGTRRSDSISASLDTLNSELESYQSSVTKLDQLSATTSFLKNESVNQRHMLSQRFMDFLSEREGGMLEAQRLLTGKGASRRLERLITEFSDIHAQGIDPVLWGKADTGKYSVTWEAGRSIQAIHQDNLSQVDEMSLSRGFGKSDPDSLRSEFKMSLNEQLGQVYRSHAQISTEGQARGDFFREEQKGDLRGNRLAFLRKSIAGQGVEHLQEHMKTTSPQLPFVYKNQ